MHKRYKVNKLYLIFFSIIFVFIIGFSFAIFSYNKLGNNQELIAGDIYMHYNESNTLTLENALPSSTYDPTKYFEFTIKGKNTNTKYNIVYDINLNYGDEIENKIRIQDRFLKFRLVEVVNNEETELFTDKSYLSIDNKRIYVSTINKNTNTEITKTYRLYVWIDKSVVIGNTNYSDYSISDWNNVYGSVKVSVTGDFSEKEIQTEPYLVMKNIYEDTNWIAVRDSITSIEFFSNGVAPESSVTSFDVTDETSSGNVTLYVLDDGLGNNTYKAIIGGESEIYAPVDSSEIFSDIPELTTFNSKNFKVDNVHDARWFFYNCAKLNDVNSLTNWNTSNFENIRAMFSKDISLKDLHFLLNWNTSNISSMVGLFANCTNLQDINGLKNWDVSNVQDISFMFQSTQIKNLDSLSNWNVSKVTNMTAIFSRCENLININGLSNWDTDSMTNMYGMFAICSSLTNIDSLANWNVENVVDMTFLFQNVQMENVNSLLNWNTSNVTNMTGIFLNCSKLNDINGLKNWNTLNVENMTALFGFCESLENINALLNWKTNNVTTLSQTFRGVKMTNLDALANWNVSNVTDMYATFGDCVNITNANAINDWSINSDADFSFMFYNTQTHPTFTKLTGIWGEDGTFTPSS